MPNPLALLEHERCDTLSCFLSNERQVKLDIYSYQGVRANIRDALIPDMAQALQRKGFSS